MSVQHLNALVAILGDSRVFDTYFTNAAYAERYGYDATFPHLLRKGALQESPAIFDIVHIPDHFRGATVENNIIRLALTDPAVVILCDGIWETLVHKDWFIEWANDRIRAHPTLSGEALDLSYSSRRLADLFIANELPVSPRNYALKQRRIISYFRRRRRQCVWMSLPMPPRDHFDRLHLAGNYRCIPEWDECLKAVNDAMAPVVTAYGATWFDLQQLVLEQGGFGRALIDQWHFSRAFHSAIARELARVLPPIVAASTLSADHVSRRFLLAHEPGAESVIVSGQEAAIGRWRAENPSIAVEAALVEDEAGRRICDIPSVTATQVSSLGARCVVLVDPPNASSDKETSLLAALPMDCILAYPDELKAMVNPTGNDRAEHGRLR